MLLGGGKLHDLAIQLGKLLLQLLPFALELLDGVLKLTTAACELLGFFAASLQIVAQLLDEISLFTRRLIEMLLLLVCLVVKLLELLFKLLFRGEGLISLLLKTAGNLLCGAELRPE